MIGYIYKITSPTIPGSYYGSTTKGLTERFSEHKRDFCTNKTFMTSFLLMENHDSEIELVEEFEYDKIIELRKREGWYQINCQCVNKNIAGSYTDNPNYMREYYEKNRDKLDKYHAEYREKNRAKYRMKHQKVIKCECGVEICKNNLKSHLLTKRHKKLLINIQQNESLEDKQSEDIKSPIEGIRQEATDKEL